MVDKWFIGFIVICMFVSGFVLGWNAGRSFEEKENGRGKRREE